MFELSCKQRNDRRKHSNRSEQVNTRATFESARQHRQQQKAEYDPRAEPEGFLMRKAREIESGIATSRCGELLRDSGKRSENRK